MSEPDPSDEVALVYNRLDRVWMFGLLRFAPDLFVIGTGLALTLWSLQAINIPVALFLIPALIILASPYVLDWWPAVSPIKLLRISQQIAIVRISGRSRVYAANRVSVLRLVLLENADYDDREAGQQYCSAAIRFWRTRTVRLVVSRKGADILTNWAHRFDIPIDGLPISDVACSDASIFELENQGESGQTAAAEIDIFANLGNAWS